MNLGLGFLALVAIAAAPSDSFSIERPDGSEIVYHVDRGANATGDQPLLLLMQGSGCDPVSANENLDGAGEVIAPGHAVLTIEKYGVPAREAAELVEGCTHDFWRGNTLSQRVIDAARVIGRLRQESWWSRELILYGGSEGGAIVAMLAPLVPETRAVVIESSGIGVPVGELVRQAVPEPMRTQALEIFAAARRNPSADEIWGGASYRWWADAVDQVPARSLVQADVPVLLVQGGRDQNAPVATARATRDLFVARGRTNLTYWEFEGYDHFMVDQTGIDHEPEVWAAIAEWLSRARAP